MTLKLQPLLKELTIRTKELHQVKLDLDALSEFAWAQKQFVAEVEKQYNAGKPVRIIVLKARQLGISTVTEGILFYWSFLYPGMSGLVMAQETQTSQDIFEKTKFYWESWPLKPYYSLKYHTKQSMYWQETSSSLRIATAKNVATGRGSTVNALHATECAYYADPYTLFDGLNQTIPDKHGSIVVLESTANGTGNWWHDQWRSAVEGDTDYVPLFFPWYLHSEYRIATTINTLLELDPYEKWIHKQKGASFEALAWRRWAIHNKAHGDIDKFMQEYPATPDEAFISTGQPIFSPQALSDCFSESVSSTNFKGQRGLLVKQNTKPKWVPDSSGSFIIYKRPVADDGRQDRYFVSGDPAETTTGDPACIQVINRATYEQVAVWHGRIDPVAFAEEMMLIGQYYNYAMLCPEIEGGGQGTIATILHSNYPNVWQHRKADRPPGKVSNDFGYSMNWVRKQWCVGDLQHFIIQRAVKIHDRKTYDQLLDYTRLPNGELGNANPRGHDDAVMALAIAVSASKAEGPFFEEAHNQNLWEDIYRQEYEGSSLDNYSASN